MADICFQKALELGGGGGSLEFQIADFYILHGKQSLIFGEKGRMRIPGGGGLYSGILP